MKTIKHIFICAASLLLLVNIPSNVYAFGNDWFEKKDNFFAYYDGMGSVNFSLLTWTWGASYNHYAYNDTASTKKDDRKRHTFVEYYISDTIVKFKNIKDNQWLKLFYYNGDNVINKKNPGMAWFYAPDNDYLFYSVSGKNYEKEKKLTNARDSVSIPHAKDDRQSVTFDLRWAVPTEMEGKYLSLRVHVSDNKDNGILYDYTYNLIESVKMEKGTQAPELMDPMLFMGGDNPQDAGMILVPYVVMDELISIQTPLSPQPVTGLSNMGSLEIQATDTVRYNFHITATVRKLNEDVISLKSNKVTIPAYHKIQSFTVTPKMDTIKDETNKKQFALVNSGYKLLTWTVNNPNDSDAMSMDYFEMERAYKADFSDAEQLEPVAYETGKKTYEFVDKNTVNNPYGSDSIYYRIRRMSASSFGWKGHPYTRSYTYVGRVKQIGMNLCTDLLQTKPYAAFSDCATDSVTDNNKIDLSARFVWPIADSAAVTAWDPLTRIEVVLWEDQEEAQIVTIDTSEYHCRVFNQKLILEFSYTADLPKTCQEYDLSVRLNTDATRFDRPKKTEFWFYPKIRTQAVNMTSIKASNDDSYPERTLIEWTADGEPDYFTVWRYKENSIAPSADVKDIEFDSIDIVDGRTNWYNDPDGVPGQPYIYMVKAVTLCTKRMESDAFAIGTRSRYGYIDGYVTYTNGNKVAGIQVCLYQAGSNTPLQTVTTKANGYYKFSGIEYNLDQHGSTYNIGVLATVQTFLPAKGGKEATVTLTPSIPAVHHVDFLSDDYRRCSGRVLYTGTTIPVRDAYFLISGQVAMNNNDTIRTDASGNFTLSVPSGINFFLTVVKDKHTFMNDGKLMIGGKDTLNLQSGSLDGVKFWDNTRVRLVGRLAGGDVQGLKPLGFGLSKNNLGDSLKLVLELEGDNIAHFVYDEKDLTKTTRDTAFVRTMGKDTTLLTPVRFEQKRVIVCPDPATGEYVIDLPPVKYRIVEASANGYATLFSAGRTAETKDLTNSLDTLQCTYDGRTNWYHDTYSVIYHAPASVRVAQLHYGMPIDFYGEEAVKGYTLNATRIDSVYTHNDKKYVFGYPVYLSGLLYNFRIYAREEYYYNNDINCDLDSVALGGHQFTVYNGLLSGTSVIKGQLNNEGYCNITVDVANESFGAVGTAALKHLDVSVNVNGQDVHAQPVQAFVLGGRITGSDALTKIGSSIIVDDVLRDPPGSNSYAWIEKGATYNSSCSLNNGFDVSLDVSTTQGKSQTYVSGTHGMVNWVPNPNNPAEFMTLNTAGFLGRVTSSSSINTWPIFSYSQSFSWNQTYNYSYTTTERIQTGSNNNIMGADATIFIGHTINAYAMHSEVFTTVDAATLSKMKPSVASGMTKIIAQKDSTSPALIVTKDLAFTLDPTPVQFVYTQDHIVNQVIPQLAAELSSLIRTGDRKSLQGIADSTKKVVYLWNEAQDTIIMLKPNSWKPDTIVPNEVEGYVKLINQWVDILYENERKEVYGTLSMLRVGSYSVSANTTVTHSEAGSAGYNYSFANNEKPDLTGLKNLPNLIRQIANYFDDKSDKKTNVEHRLDGLFGSAWKLNITPNADFRGTQTSGNNQTQNRNIGFTLSQAEYGYIDVDVYSLAGTVDSTFSNWRDKATTFLTRDSMKTGNYDCSDFIYVLRGGATRCPYIGENKTQFFRPGTMLDPATVKLDEAHMEVDKHEVSGVAADGVAVFDLQIWNESEAAPGVANGPHNFVLKLLEGTNPNGAKASIDGLALTGMGRNFYLEPGQVIHKKLEVRRGALALDYDNLKLCLMSDCDTSNYANQYISVHFLPASTPVRISTPDDKWVMNTNSPYDKQGYYLPVVIDGFDTEYANFDHIELQYKLSTQSENDWVTLCSYYADSVYYDKANGNKQMFNKSAGRIDNIHFYGERDPMEQRYDLRAVSYCRYGTDYVTTASEPVSGIKDTRRPRLFGNIAPANGVLTKQDYIYVPFSEPIAYNYLDEDNNFQVVGFKNKADYFSTPTLTFSGNSDSYARTQTTRNLIGDYSIDLTVYQENTSGKVAYFSFGKNIEFGRKDSLLYARINDTEVLASRGGLPTGGFARVVMTYNATKDIVRFYIGTQPVGEAVAHSATGSTDTAVDAPFVFGVGVKDPNPFKGRMAEARIWSKALTFGELTSTNNTCLTGYENGLLAYYPMTEGSGNIAYDKAHGADAVLTNVTWNMPEGKALKVNDAKGVQMDAQWFNNGADADYTLLFSFKSDPAEPFSSDEDVLLFGDINARTDTANRQVGIFMTQEGQIVLVPDSVNRLVADGNYNDGAWHTLGLVVARGYNYTHLYIDGQLKAQANGQFFGAWAMSQTILGRNFSSGCFDELSMWEFAMPQDYLSEFDTYAPNGQEMGLRCYLPFDQRILNDNSVYETHYSPYNARLYYNSDKQEWYAKQDIVIRSQLDDKSTTTDVCPLIRNSEYEKIRFDWVGNNNELIINLNVPDMEINHKNVFFSLRDVEDLQGNRLLNPIAWSVYVDRNVIRWDEQNLWIIKSAGMMDTVVYTTITNHSGKDKPFVISGLPDWLTVDEPVGTLKPQEQRVLVFTVSGDLNAGDYVAPVSLTDETGMSDQMLVNVRVEAVFPNWSVPNDFNQNMNLIGTVHLQNEARGAYVDTDTRDIVGAFYGNTCVGMQSITSKVGSTANLYLKVYGKADMNKKDISLRLWQASTGKTYILKPENEVIRFVADTVYGSVQKPVQLRVADSRVQNIPVYTGWNWISFYVQPSDINSSFVNVGGFSSNDQIKVYRDERVASSELDAAVYTQGRWSNNIMLDYRNIYMMNVSSSMVLEVRGLATGQAPELTFRHGWNNLPCLFEANTPIDAAMADYFNAAKDGDIITGYYQFAVFDNKQWVGSLETLIPGEGYMLYRQAKDEVTVHFYPSVPATAPRKKVESERGSESRTYSTAMPIVAALESNEVAINLDNAVLRAYAHDELVGEAKAVDGMWFLLVHAKDNAELTFTITDDKGEEYSASNVLNYGAFAPTGTVHNPYLIRFGESDLRKVMENGILYIHRNGNTYNAQGTKL